MATADGRPLLYRALVRTLDGVARSPAGWAVARTASRLLRCSPYRMRGRALLAEGLEAAVVGRAARRDLVARIRGGAKFRVPPVPEGASLYFYGCLPGPDEQKITHFLERYLRPGDTFVDIGANVGFYSMLAAAACGTRGRVIAFEPQQDLAANLERCAALNGWSGCFTVRNAALSDLDQDDARLFLPVDGRTRGSASFVAYAAVDGNRSVAATVRKGDSEFAALKIDKAAAIKIDVEGFEAKVLNGLRSSLAKSPPPIVIVELFLLTSGSLSEAQSAVSLMRELGYAMYDLSPAGELLGPIGREEWITIPSVRSYAFVYAGGVARLAESGLLP